MQKNVPKNIHTSKVKQVKHKDKMPHSVYMFRILHVLHIVKDNNGI